MQRAPPLLPAPPPHLCVLTDYAADVAAALRDVPLDAPRQAHIVVSVHVDLARGTGGGARSNGRAAAAGRGGWLRGKEVGAPAAGPDTSRRARRQQTRPAATKRAASCARRRDRRGPASCRAAPRRAGGRGLPRAPRHLHVQLLPQLRVVEHEDALHDYYVRRLQLADLQGPGLGREVAGSAAARPQRRRPAARRGGAAGGAARRRRRQPASARQSRCGRGEQRGAHG
jgi:hypothetical protein